jgi:hypothetical protein
LGWVAAAFFDAAFFAAGLRAMVFFVGFAVVLAFAFDFVGFVDFALRFFVLAMIVTRV